MRSVKVIFLLVVTLGLSKGISAQYVQPMRYDHYSFTQQANIGVGTVRTTAPSAYLEVGPTSGANKGFLPPRLTTTQRDGISSPAAGLFIYNTTTARYNFYNGVAWSDINTSSGVDSIWRVLGVDSIFFLKNGNTYKIKDSSGGSPNSNIGTGYRLAVPGTNNVKTLFGGYGILWDSTSNANALTAKLDSATVFPNIRSTIPTGGSSTPDTIHKQLTSVIDPTSLTFALKRKERWLGFLDEKDVILDLKGGILNRTDWYTTTGQTVTKTNSNGDVTFSVPGGSFIATTIKFGAAPKGPFWVMELKLKGYTGNPPYFAAGLFKDSTNFIGAGFELTSGNIFGINRINGTDNVSTGGSFPFQPKMTFYVIGSGDYIKIAFVDSLGSITWGSTLNIQYTRGLSSKTVLDGEYHFGFYLATGSGAASLTIESIRAGYFKGVGLSDISFVNDETGVPLIVGNSAFFTASIKGFTPVSDCAAMCTGVFKMNTKSFEYERMSLIFRDNGTNIVNDADPCLVYDKERKRFKYFVAPWGDDRGFTLDSSDFRLYYKEVDENLINGVHVLDSMTKLDIGGRDITYDIGVVKKNGEWIVGFSYYPSRELSIPPYRFAMAKTTDFVTWTTLVDTSLYNSYEGLNVVKIADTVYMSTSTLTGSKFVLFKTDGTKRGDITHPSITSSQPPHPAIIPLIENGKTRFLLMTFDSGTSTNYPGTGDAYTNGNTYIFLSHQTEQGYEYPIYRTPIISVNE